jgi:hypothetical protein
MLRDGSEATEFKSRRHAPDTEVKVIIESQEGLFSRDSGARNRNTSYIETAMYVDGDASSVVFRGVINLLF